MKTHIRAQGAILALSVIGCAAALPAAAETTPPVIPYVRADFGYAIGTVGNGGDIANGPGFGNDFGDSGSFGGGIGVKFPTLTVAPVSFRFDVTANTSPSLGGGNHTASLSDGTPVSAKVKVQNVTYLANFYADFDIDAPITPFVGIGAGLARNRVGSLNYTNAAGGFATVDGNSHVGGAWSVTAGASYEIVKDLAVDLSYRYIYAGVVRTSGTITDTTQTPRVVQSLDRPISSSLDLHQFTVSLRYAF